MRITITELNRDQDEWNDSMMMGQWTKYGFLGVDEDGTGITMDIEWKRNGKCGYESKTWLKW